MAFTIRCKDMNEAGLVVNTIREFIERSRFVLATGRGQMGRQQGISIFSTSRKTQVEIRGVRLRVKKGNCGAHAGPCQLTWKKHPKNSFLEGLDWVSWNQMLNDALDSIGHDGNVKSTVCIIRKGRERRLDYFSSSGNGDFDKDSDCYGSFCGTRPPETDYEYGTPGIIGWGVECIESPYETA